MSDTLSLLSLVLTLRPLQPAADLPHLGRAAHALLLDAVRRSDPALAESIHAGSDLRPLTASGLIGYSARAGLNPERTYAVRLTALNAPVAQALRTAAQAGPLRPGEVVRLDEHHFRVEAATDDAAEHPWARAMSYEALSAPWLLGRESPARRVGLEFVSPTTFRSDGKHVPVPMPEWVFGSLREKWNAFAPVALPDEVRRFAAECLALSRFDLRTYSLPLKEGLRIGAVGRATYTALNTDRYWLSLINLLADFALFAGVGAGTTMGLGQCRRVSSDR